MSARSQKPSTPPTPDSTFPVDSVMWARTKRSLGLSPQQARIIELVILGRRDKQIAAELGIGLPTVRTYLTRLFHKMDVDDRVGLVVHVFAAIIREAPRR